MHSRSLVLALLLLAGLLGGIEPALAHKVKVFATVEGTVLSGYVYYPGGGKAKNVPVRFLDPHGVSLGETTTNDEGEFRFTATVRVDHRIVVDTGEGHRAEFTVPAADLPESLGTPVAAAPVAPADPRPAASVPANPEAVATGPTAEALQELIEKAVARQVRPLREQLDAYEAKIRWHDMLGGIGYILGLAGLSFYLLVRRSPPTG
jgi:nickel transport protein